MDSSDTPDSLSDPAPQSVNNAHANVRTEQEDVEATAEPPSARPPESTGAEARGAQANQNKRRRVLPWNIQRTSPDALDHAIDRALGFPPYRHTTQASTGPDDYVHQLSQLRRRRELARRKRTAASRRRSSTMRDRVPSSSESDAAPRREVEAEAAKYVLQPEEGSPQASAKCYTASEIMLIPLPRPRVEYPSEDQAPSAALPLSEHVTALPAQDGAIVCLLCLTSERQLASVPCMHLSICKSCARQMDQVQIRERGRLRRQETRCPICRASVDSWLRVYLS